MPSTKLPTKRRHATMACIFCRESKVKCDGSQPACSNCVNRNRECHYQAIDRRKLPLRVAIELLSNKVDQLRHFITENGLQPPRLPHEKERALKKILETLGMNEASSTSTQQTDYEPEKSFNAPRDLTMCLPNVSQTAVTTPKTGSEGCGTGPFAGKETETESRAVFTSRPTTVHNAASRIPFSGDPQNVTEDCPSNVLNSWDLDLGFGTCITPALLNLQQFIGCSPENTSDVEQDEIPALPAPIVSNDDSTLVGESGSTTDTESLIDEISDRVGTLRIGPGGKTHFCGPTSTFNLKGVLDSEDPEARPMIESYSLQDSDHFGSETEIPLALEEHLINLYFCWQDPSFHVVDRKVYEEARAKWQNMEETPFYSEALRYAMCALGSAFEARFHSTFVTFPKSLVDFLGARAKSLLELELDCACVATVQAMVILSNHEIGNGKDARGWLYSGMAIRLAFDLALHLDMSPYVSRGDIAPADADLRRTVFWAAYVVDHQLGFHLGRPFRTSMEDVTVGKPLDQVNQLSPYSWAPYENSNTASETSGLLDCTEAVSQQLVSLCEIMAPCGYILYGTSRISKAILQELNAKIVAELREWKARLPPFLQINLDDYTSPYLPHVLLLHMQYHQNIIYAHRPWMSKSGLQPQPPKGPGYLHAREMCITSAIAISKILVLYETRYTLRRINVKAVSITSSAVLLLLFAAVTKYLPHSQRDIALYLGTCFRALDEFALSWQSARRAKDILVNLQRQWEIRTRTRKVIRKPRGGTYIPRKRSRLLNGIYQTTPTRNEQPTRSGYDPNMDFHIDSELDWMLMNDGQSISDNFNLDMSELVSESRFFGPNLGCT